MANILVTLHMPRGDFTAILSTDDAALASAEADAFARDMHAPAFSLLTPDGAVLGRTTVTLPHKAPQPSKPAA